MIGVLLLVVWRVYPFVLIFTGLNLCVDSDFSRIDDVIPPKKEITVAHLGLSHPMYESDSLYTEILFKPRNIIHGHGFETSEQEGTVIDAISRVLADRTTYIPWRGEKLCGGFHADYYFMWKDGSKAWEVLLCMGCREAIMFHDGLSLRCDIALDAEKRISAIVENDGE